MKMLIEIEHWIIWPMWNRLERWMNDSNSNNNY